MTEYLVRFLKNLCDDTGHECVTCQGEFLLRGTSAGQAIEEAEAAFCEARATDRWDLFADAVEIRIASGRDAVAPRLKSRGQGTSLAATYFPLPR